MRKPLYRTRPKTNPWSPIAVVLSLTAGMVVLVGLFQLITHIASA